jgi:large subunit ribosomal protein L27
MAHKKGQSSSRNGRDSQSQRRGVKVFGSEIVPAGSILVRQCGTTIYPGANVGMGRDFTLYAKVNGTAVYKKGRKDRIAVSIVPLA